MPHGYFSFPKVIRGSIVQALAECVPSSGTPCTGSRARPDRASPPGRTRGGNPDRRRRPSPAHAESRPVGNPVARHTEPSNCGRRTDDLQTTEVHYCRYFSSWSTHAARRSIVRHSGRTPASPAAGATDPSTDRERPEAGPAGRAPPAGVQRAVLHLRAELVLLVDQRADLGQDLMFVHLDAPSFFAGRHGHDPADRTLRSGLDLDHRHQVVDAVEVGAVSGKEVQATGVCRRCDEEICESTAWLASFSR